MESESTPIKVMAQTYHILLSASITRLLEVAGGDYYVAQSLALMAAERLRSGNHVDFVQRYNSLNSNTEDKAESQTTNEG